MTVNFSQAIDAYSRAVAKSGKEGAASNSAAPAGASFADLVSRAAEGAVKAGRAGEQVAMQAVANQADLNQVVTAVTNAEVTLQTVVAIRDRVIQAYQDIIRMPI
ncbi:MAG: flagellar hook-basal body complex protein FliE [Alphaproteobacteria bacterium]